MKLGIMQPYFFPYIGYWQILNLVDEYIIYDDVNYIKGGWINRNNILVNGQPHRINLFLQAPSPNKLIKDIQVGQTQRDTKKLLATISQSYRKAPYFQKSYEVIERIMNYGDYSLAGWLTHQIEEICKCLEIDTKILLSSQIEKNCTLKGEQKVINICGSRNADCYINAIGGKELYCHDYFQQHDIGLKFLRTSDIWYKQFEDTFIPNLSIIDVMMFNSVEKIRELLKAYQLED